MKKFLSSIFIKHMLIFVSIMFMTSILAPFFAFIVFDVNNLESMSQHNTLEKLPRFFALRTGIFSIVIGTIFITISSKIIIKPITELSKATMEVTNGNFHVHVKNYSKNDELAILTNNFNTMVRQLSKNEYLHKEFVSNVSHEFKTPIAAIAGYAEILSSEQLSEEKHKEYCEIIINQINRISKLSSDLLRISELENNEFPLRLSNIPLDEQIRDAVLLMQNEWEDKHIEMDIVLEEVAFMGDQNLLYQVWVNIINNAIKYNREGGRIQIRGYHSDRIHIEILDTGIGLTAEEIPRVFDRFYKADISRNSSGTGLGLPIAKRIIELHNGKINMESTINQGTKVSIVL